MLVIGMFHIWSSTCIWVARALLLFPRVNTSTVHQLSLTICCDRRCTRQLCLIMKSAAAFHSLQLVVVFLWYSNQATAGGNLSAWVPKSL